MSLETIEYKQLSLDFRAGLDTLVSDLEDVEDGKISEEGDRQAIISRAEGKLKEYDGLLKTLEDHFAKRLKETVEIGENMEYMRELLESIESA